MEKNSYKPRNSKRLQDRGYKFAFYFCIQFGFCFVRCLFVLRINRATIALAIVPTLACTELTLQKCIFFPSKKVNQRCHLHCARLTMPQMVDPLFHSMMPSMIRCDSVERNSHALAETSLGGDWCRSRVQIDKSS